MPATRSVSGAAALAHRGRRRVICSYECTFCTRCGSQLERICPNCERRARLAAAATRRAVRRWLDDVRAALGPFDDVTLGRIVPSTTRHELVIATRVSPPDGDSSQRSGARLVIGREDSRSWIARRTFASRRAPRSSGRRETREFARRGIERSSFTTGRQWRAHLYVHLPFCAHRCGYCDFVTVVGRRDEHARYVDALLVELELERDVLAPRLETIFLGGGTPTFTEPAALERLLAALPDADEVTVEANPETVTSGAGTSSATRTVSIVCQ